MTKASTCVRATLMPASEAADLVVAHRAQRAAEPAARQVGEHQEGTISAQPQAIHACQRSSGEVRAQRRPGTRAR